LLPAEKKQKSAQRSGVFICQQKIHPAVIASYTGIVNTMQRSLNMESINPASTRVIYYYLLLLLLIAGITSVVVVPSVAATVPSYLLIYAGSPFIAWFSMRNNKALLKEGLGIVLVFAVMNLVAQVHNSIAGVRLTPGLILVEGGNPGKVLFRNTLFTQSLYLFAGVLFYLYLKYYAVEKHVRYVYLGLRLLVVYGLFEVVLFLITGKNSDYLSNRVFVNNGVANTGSAFAVMNVMGLDLLRVKSLTGEPSMFALAVIPFWILSSGLNRKTDWWLFGAALVLSFSTSAFLGLFIGMAGWLLYHPARRKIAWLLPPLLLAGGIMYYSNDAFRALLNEVIFDKITTKNASGAERGGFLLQHLHYWWYELGFMGKLFGIGFGYVRSTDFLSTILVNNGLTGLALFTWFFFKPAFGHFSHARLRYAYITALVATYFILMVAVPEFACFSIWILLAFPYFQKRPSRPASATRFPGQQVLERELSLVKPRLPKEELI
jgi:hypothetical protein